MTEKTEPARSPDQVWEYLNNPTPWALINWKQQTKPKQSTSGRNSGKFFSLYVAYIDSQYVREKLTEVAGSWSLTMRPVAPVETKLDEERISIIASLEVLGVIREDIGSGRNYKNAATDAFKRAAARFGLGADLYSLPKIYVEMDGGEKFSKPVRGPDQEFMRLFPAIAADHGAPVRGADPAPAPLKRDPTPTPAPTPPKAPAAAKAPPKPRPENPVAANSRAADVPLCPKCNGAMWDNRREKAEGTRPANAPDFRCRDKACVDPQTQRTTALWLSGDGKDVATDPPVVPRPAVSEKNRGRSMPAPADPDDDLPF